MSSRPGHPLSLGGGDGAPACSSGKRGWATEAEAAARLAAGRPDGNDGRRPGVTEVAVHKCKACGWWHLTSRSRPVRRGQDADRKKRRR